MSKSRIGLKRTAHEIKNDIWPAEYAPDDPRRIAIQKHESNEAKKIVRIVLEENLHVGPTFYAYNATGECLGEWIEECMKGSGKIYSITEAAFGIAKTLREELYSDMAPDA